MFNRASQSRVPNTRDVTFPAPTKGWVKSGNITSAGMDQAEVMDNLFPTAQGARLRSGKSVYATLGAAVKRLMVYSSNTDKLFASSTTAIFDADRINAGGSNFADVFGLISGDWSAVQISTTGGQFMVAVNGSDAAHYYNGAAWNPINGVAVNRINYTALVTNFAVGQTVTGGTSAATGVISSIVKTSATAGSLRIGAITGGPFVNAENLTSATGAATASGDSASSSAITITGVVTTDLAQTWLFKRRLFFVKKNSLSAFFLPVDSIGGAASEIPLGAVFRRGGTLLFGATWSLDSGSGLDDVCIFVSSLGEIAVYEGTDPSSASTWALTGVYDIDAPLNKHAVFKAGGDLAILTSDGIIPVSEALRKDRAALQSVAISYPIEDEWKSAVANATGSFPVTPTLWQSQAMLMIGVPGSGGVAFVANARTGAWCRYTGWDVRCGAVSSNLLFFGSDDGIVYRGESGGTDAGSAYVARYVPKFSDMGTPERKMAMHAGITCRAAAEPAFRMAAFKDYEIGTYPAGSPLNTITGDVWGTGVWGTFIWGSGAATYTYTRWKTVRAAGYSLAPAIVVSSNQTTAPAFELLATRLRFETARTL